MQPAPTSQALRKPSRRTAWRAALLACACLALVSFAPRDARAEGFYNQPPFSSAELLRFIDDFPRFRAWARSAGETPHPGTTDAGQPTFEYSPKAAAEVERMGWTAQRFFCVMGRSAAALAVIEEGDALSGANRPADMPTVTDGETELVRRHLTSLLRAVIE